MVKSSALMLGCALACHERPNVPARVERDSAGIPIVDNAEPIWKPDGGWVIERQPVLRLDGDVTLGQPRHVIAVDRLSNGDVVVLLDQEVRWFDRAGHLRRTIARQGDGPGEFRELYDLDVTPGDSVAVYGAGGEAKLAVYTPDGAVAREARIDFSWMSRRGLGACGMVEFAGRLPIGCRPDSSIAPSTTNRHGGDPGPGLVRQLSRVFYLPSGEDTAFALGLDIGIESFGIATGQANRYYTHPLRVSSQMAFGGRAPRIVMAANPEYRVEVWTLRGKLERIITRPQGRRPPTERERIDVDETMKRWYGPGGIWAYPRDGDQYRLVPMPDSLPAVLNLAVDDGGNIFVTRDGSLPSDTASTIDVFDSTGRWLGAMSAPPRIKIFAVTDTDIVIRRQDADDVPSVEVYRLHRGRR
jgi:hypothetical protein